MVPLKRVLLPFAFIAFLLILTHNIKSFRPIHFYNSNEPLRVAISIQTGNKSLPAPFLVPQHEVSEQSNAPKASLNKLPVALADFTTCPQLPNAYTNHIRLPNLLYNISMQPKLGGSHEGRIFWNPTIIALPSWAKNHYIVVSMVAPDGDPFRRNVICEANICHHPKSNETRVSREIQCSDEDLALLGPNGGLRCVDAPTELKVPPTPAARCEGREQVFADIPGFHDPRLFYTARGEPILMVSSQSQYACIGLWVLDLRVVYPDLNDLFSSSPKRLGPGPLISYPTITELTRNPKSSRESYEKNWVMFSITPSSSYLQYELNSKTRTIAKLVGGGLTTPNITSPLEESCLRDPTPEEIESGRYTNGTAWHQATPALKLMLCPRHNITCQDIPENMVFIAAIHRKVLDDLGLPTRYERYMVTWSAAPPFHMLAVSSHPILFFNETVSGWTADESWDDVPDFDLDERDRWADFTYTTTIAYAWGRDEGDVKEKGVGYLDDEIVFSVGINDMGQAYGKVSVGEILACLRICPGVV